RAAQGPPGDDALVGAPPATAVRRRSRRCARRRRRQPGVGGRRDGRHRRRVAAGGVAARRRRGAAHPALHAVCARAAVGRRVSGIGAAGRAGGGAPLLRGRDAPARSDRAPGGATPWRPHLTSLEAAMLKPLVAIVLFVLAAMPAVAAEETPTRYVKTP